MSKAKKIPWEDIPKSEGAKVIQEAFTDKEFNEILEHNLKVEQGFMEREGEEIMPKIFLVMNRHVDGKRVIALGLIPEMGEDRFNMFFGIGKKFGAGKEQIVAALFASTAWMGPPSELMPGDKEYVRPSEHPNRQEALVIGGMTIDGRSNMGTASYKKIGDSYMFGSPVIMKYTKNHKDGQTESDLLKSFFEGYLSGRVGDKMTHVNNKVN